MQKWEYKFFFSTGNKLEKQLNDLGEQGWEAVNMSASFAWVACLMKRAQA